MDCETCPICLDDLDIEKDITVLKCNHRYHKLCIDLWFKKKQICPLCRTPYFENYNCRDLLFPYFKNKISFIDDGIIIKSWLNQKEIKYNHIKKIMCFYKMVSIEVKSKNNKFKFIKYKFKNSEFSSYFFTNLKNKILNLE